MRLILVLKGYDPTIHPSKVGEFEWIPKHKAYVWQGRELKPAEFNDTVDRVFRQNKDLWDHPVTVRAIQNEAPLEKARATLERQRNAQSPPILKPPSPHVPSSHLLAPV